MEQRHNDTGYQRNSTPGLFVGIAAGNGAYWSGQLDEMPWTMASSFARISVCRRDSLTFLASPSKDTTIYSTSRHGQHIIICQSGPRLSTSSPQNSSSPHRSLTRFHVCKNWVIPWNRTWSANFFASSHGRGVPKERRPIQVVCVQENLGKNVMTNSHLIWRYLAQWTENREVARLKN